MSATLVLFLLLLSSLGVPCEAQLTQERVVVASDGRELNLSCSHPSATNENICWYRQFPNQPPRIIVWGYQQQARSTDPPGVLYISADRKESVFSFSKVTLADSAVYLCALEDFGGNKVTFAGGSRLFILPNLEDSEPSIYQLNPQQKEDEPPISACLFTDYSPDNILIGLNSTLNPVNSSIVLVDDGYSSTASYGTVLWGNNDRNISCHASYNGKIYIKDHMEDDGDACLTGEFETDEKLNFLSLTVLGLRIIFLKTVAVNLILTFRLWSC